MAIAVLFLSPPSLAAPPPASPAGSRGQTLKHADSVYDEDPANKDPDIYTEDPTERARLWFIAGVAAAEKGMWVEACNAFTAAWGLKQHWQIAYQLAKAEIHLGRARSALVHLKAVLTSDDKQAQRAKTEIVALMAGERAKLVQLEVSGKPAGARVLVDGEFRGKLPLAGPLEVDPGVRDVELRLGSVTTHKKVVATSGQVASAHLEMAMPEPTVPVARPEPSSAPMWIGLSGLALGLIGGVTGAALWVSADKNSSIASGPYPQAKQQEALTLELRERAGAAGLWAASGAILLGGAVYWIYSRSEPASLATAVSLMPILAPGRLGLQATATW